MFLLLVLLSALPSSRVHEGSKEDWDTYLGGGTAWRVYYEQTRSQFEEIYNSHYPH